MSDGFSTARYPENRAAGVPRKQGRPRDLRGLAGKLPSKLRSASRHAGRGFPGNGQGVVPGPMGIRPSVWRLTPRSACDPASGPVKNEGQ